MQKVAFDIAGFSIYWYGIFLALGLLAGIWTASRRAMRDRLRPEFIIDLAPWLVLGTLIGARLLYVITYWEESFAGRPFSTVFNIRSGGLVFYGGLIGATLAAVLYLKIKRLPLWKVADALAPSIALGHAIGRIGCLMYGCCYGKVCTLPWGIQFPEDHATHPDHVHPTQIYESLLNFGLYAVLAWMYRRKQFDGQIFALYLLGYAVVRSLVELFRGDYPAYHAGWITPAHFLSLGLLIVGGALFFLLRKSRHQPAKS